jgi:hypothetical protein
MEMKAIAERKKMEAMEAAKRDGTPMPTDEPEDFAVDPLIPDEPLAPGGAPLNDADPEEGNGGETQVMDEDFAAELLDIKERKLLASRDTLQYHREWTLWERRKLALRVQYGWMGKRDRDLTEVLPWLLLGRREMSTNQATLLQMGVTHILNMTSDLPCIFPNTFIYQRVPIKDSMKADIAQYFPTIINFIKRVEKCKGRVSPADFSPHPLRYYVFRTNSRPVPCWLADCAGFGALHHWRLSCAIGGAGVPGVCARHPAGGRVPLPDGAAADHHAQPALPLRAGQVRGEHDPLLLALIFEMQF